jgi:hypothetical protein
VEGESLIILINNKKFNFKNSAKALLRSTAQYMPHGIRRRLEGHAARVRGSAGKVG